MFFSQGSWYFYFIWYTHFSDKAILHQVRNYIIWKRWDGYIVQYAVFLLIVACVYVSFLGWLRCKHFLLHCFVIIGTFETHGDINSVCRSLYSFLPLPFFQITVKACIILLSLTFAHSKTASIDSITIQGMLLCFYKWLAQAISIFLGLRPQRHWRGECCEKLGDEISLGLCFLILTLLCIIAQWFAKISGTSFLLFNSTALVLHIASRLP